jgi:hypothetical protein
MDPPRLDSSRDPSIPRGNGNVLTFMDTFLRDYGLVEDSYTSMVPSTQDNDIMSCRNDATTTSRRRSNDVGDSKVLNAVVSFIYGGGGT